MDAKAFDPGFAARTRKIAEAIIGGKTTVVEELLPWFGDFKGEPVIQVRETGSNKLVAFAGFRTDAGFGRALTDGTPGWVELRQLTVMPRFRGKKIGSELLKLIVHLAKKSKVPLYLHPQATSEKPIPDAELKAFYARHGFRPFTEEEVGEITRRIRMEEIKKRLLFDGFQHGTRRMTGPARYSLSRQQVQSMNRYTDDDLIETYRAHMRNKYQYDLAHETNWRNQEERVSEHMPMAARNPNDEPRLFPPNPSYRFPNATRIKAAWRRIRATGKKPAKVPKSVARPRI